MSLAPFTDASPAIQIHASAALAAFILGLVQLAGMKGTTSHRTLGYTWVGLMLIVTISSFWIHEIRLWGAWSAIHLLSIFSLAMLPLGVWHARRHNVRRHKLTMLGLFAGALAIAGVFTLAPGRIMHRMVFGG
jgi:uncharacterized membrane protein